MRSRLTGDPTRFDMRDILISQQIRRISELEHEVADLKARLDRGE